MPIILNVFVLAAMTSRLARAVRAGRLARWRAKAAVRWSRTVGAISWEVMRKIRQSSVTLVGAGRNGSLMALELAALGVERLRIIDPDPLRIENLDGMPGIRQRDVGRPKVQALSVLLHRFRPDMALTLLPSSATDDAASRLMQRRCDLLVTCVDDDTPRLAAAIIARRTLTPHLDVGTSVQRGEHGTSITGDVRLLLPWEGGYASARICVLVPPGFTEFIRIFVSFNSSANTWVNPSKPNLDAA